MQMSEHEERCAKVRYHRICAAVREDEETWFTCVLSHSILPSAMVTIRVEHRETIYPLSGRRLLTCKDVPCLNIAMLDQRAPEWLCRERSSAC